MSSFYTLLSFFHVASSLNWFIGNNITLSWQSNKIKDKTVNISLCIGQPVPNNCSFIIKQNELNSGKIQLNSLDFEFKTTAKQLQIQQNSTGYFAVSGSLSDGYFPASETLHILQTVITSTPIYGGTLSQNKRKLMTNSFDLMLYKDVFSNVDIKNLTAYFVQMNRTTFEWKEILNTNVAFITNTSKISKVVGDYLIISDIKGIVLNDQHIAYGGPYFLWFGLKDSNYYSINSQFEYLIFNERNVSFNLAQHTFKPYDDVAMNITVGNELIHIPIYVAITNKNRIFVAECTPHIFSYYHSFGWKWNYSSNIETGFLYNASIYWSSIDAAHELHAPIRINITNTKSITEPIQYNKLQFNAASNGTVAISSSFNIGTKFSLQIKQCIDSRCKWIGNVLHFVYQKKQQSQIIYISQSVQTSMFTKGLTSYLVATAYLCDKHALNISTEIDILPLFTRYIIGDVIENIEWDPLSIGKVNEMIELRLLYWNNATATHQILSLGMIQNNGTLEHFTPNLTINTNQFLIENGAIGIFNLFVNKNKKGKELNITSKAYNLFHALSIDDDFFGGVITTDANNDNVDHIVCGMVADSLINNELFLFNVYLINGANSLKRYRLNNISSIINKTECDGGYCPFTLHLQLQFNNLSALNDGLYLLGISRYNKSTSPLYTNYFTISNNESCQFLVYSSKNINIEMDAISNATIDIIPYEYKSISITYDAMDIMIYATLESANNIFIFECGPHHMTQYTSFGWKFSSLLHYNGADIAHGSYAVKLYWDAPKAKTSIGVNHKYELNTRYPLKVNVINHTVVDIISVKHGSQKLYKGSSSVFVFSSSVAAGSAVNVHYEQCIEDEQCIHYYPNDDGKPYRFYLKEPIVSQTETINIPNNISLRVKDDYQMWMVIDIELCDNKTISTRQNITIYQVEKSHKTNKLEASAVVAAVCAFGVFLALAIWWLFMINSGGDGYRTLDE